MRPPHFLAFLAHFARLFSLALRQQVEAQTAPKAL
ncbi:hypothetical protein HNQ09_002883 [Deinococcus budaensis]|uniref:Uncharacterized protein n=1 Tax=Deinococcus budaensis TaxID=1665626 RepID=A0A7W8GHT7_9DEIO|nr:hypothetical protein [Deinococcus budaensis]